MIKPRRLGRRMVSEFVAFFIAGTREESVQELGILVEASFALALSRLWRRGHPIRLSRRNLADCEEGKVRLCVVDGQGGGIGAALIRRLKEVYREEHEVIALGNSR